MKLCYLLLALFLAGCTHTPPFSTGVDPKNFDPTVKPQDDFYLYANGGWMKANPIPPAYSRWGIFSVIDERNKLAMRAMLERVAQSANPSFVEKLAGDFYASGMDEAAIEAAGLAPLQPELARIAAIKDVAQLSEAVGRLHVLRVFSAFDFFSEQDPDNSAMMIGAAGQGGLGLPDRDYYFRDDDHSQKIREQYLAHIQKMFELAGDAPAAAVVQAQAVMKLETALAQVSRTHADLRDPHANYHRMTVGALQKLTPHFSWDRYFLAISLVRPGDLDIGQPEFFEGFEKQITATSLADWKSYLRWQLLSSTAAYLSSSFVNEDFEFNGRILTGAQQLRERWKRMLSVVDRNAGEALGQLYVAEYFPPSSKARVLEMIGNLRAALRERLLNLAWMDEATRAAALKKLDSLHVKVGYPDQWRDYSKLVIDRGPLVLNVLRAREFESYRELAQIGQPVDRTEWGMTPPTVNAYFNVSMNEVVFPAGILQPPFFDPTADDASNYGATGATIGHEMTHGYDDEGRQYDATGNLKDWWSPESEARFKERAAGIVKQFNEYTVLDNLHLNGEVNQGENIADLGGLIIAYAAMEKALAGHPREVIGGFTPEQRFFLSYAFSWAESQRPEGLRMQVLTNAHSPASFRTNGPLSNLPEFWAAFNVPEGAPMRRSGADRVSIW